MFAILSPACISLNAFNTSGPVLAGVSANRYGVYGLQALLVRFTMGWTFLIIQLPKN